MLDPLEPIAEFFDYNDCFPSAGLLVADGFRSACLLLAVPAVLFATWINRRFQNTLNQYLHVAAQNGFTGVTAVRRLLERAGVRGVRIVPTRGLLVTDHYNPLTKELALSHGIYNSASVAALGIAAHEAGHAIQHARNYFPMWLRSVLVPVANVSFILGCLAMGFGALHSPGLVWAGMALFACCLLFPIVTLPVEFDASARARELAVEAGIIEPTERHGMDQVLRAAALTYVAKTLKIWFIFGVLIVYLALGWEQSDPLIGDGIPGFGFLTVITCLMVVWFSQRARAPKASAPSARDWNDTGNLFADQGELTEAIAAFTRALRLDPNLAEAYTNRGATYSRTGQLDEALADLDTAIRLAPGSADAYTCRGHVRLARGEYDEALADYDEALRLAPERAAILYASRGAVGLARGAHDRAIQDYTEALCHSGEQAAVLRDRGLAWLLKGDLDRAVADLDESIQLEAGDAVAYNNRGAALLKRGDYARAAADLRKAIQLQPDLPNAYKNLAWLQATCPEPEFRNGAEAVANAARAVRRTEGKAIAWLAILAAAHAEAGDFTEAVRWQAKCLDESPPEAKAELQARLDLYRARRPFRDRPLGMPESQQVSTSVG
ncbi:MAG: zinc metallopeptidase [Gemmataceae bacterium]|nr:zinc metallopeptidase [Gemmataceae bacterium]